MSPYLLKQEENVLSTEYFFDSDSDFMWVVDIPRHAGDSIRIRKCLKANERYQTTFSYALREYFSIPDWLNIEIETLIENQARCSHAF